MVKINDFRGDLTDISGEKHDCTGPMILESTWTKQRLMGSGTCEMKFQNVVIHIQRQTILTGQNYLFIFIIKNMYS